MNDDATTHGTCDSDGICKCYIFYEGVKCDQHWSVHQGNIYFDYSTNFPTKDNKRSFGKMYF